MLIILLAIYTLNIGFKNEIPKVVTPNLLVKQKGKISDTQVSYITYFDVWAFFCVLPLFFLILVWTVRTRLSISTNSPVQLCPRSPS